ncbi:amino acid ABC transporter permease [Oceanobacillus sp. CF4.6]|uniref:amino acid ABC transporter permease n=1 Tax=Oceanobacillus sp. CF4.6 TaxID=3373080 RepID=UPI003EE74BFE
MDIVLIALPFLLKAALITIFLAVVSMAIGLVIGLITALARVSKNKLFYNMATFYVSLIRGTPVLVQIYLVYFGLPQIGITLGAMTSGIIALSINTGAYLSESFRAAILSVDKGQTEAAHSIGMTNWQSMRRIIIPQSVRTAIPTVGNTYIGLLKETSLVSVITVTELLYQTTLIIAKTFQPLTLYAAAAVIYWLICTGFNVLLTWLERRSSRHLNV